MKHIWITCDDDYWEKIYTNKPDDGGHDAVVEVVIEDPDQLALFELMLSVEEFFPDGMEMDGYFNCLCMAGHTVSNQRECDPDDQYVFCVHGPEGSRSVRVFRLHNGQPPSDVCGEPIQAMYGLDLGDCDVITALLAWKPSCQAWLGLMSTVATAVLRYEDDEEDYDE